LYAILEDRYRKPIYRWHSHAKL